jgi:ribonucleoside-diphosphate reductase alpha chain
MHLSPAAQQLLQDRYLLPGESAVELIRRVAGAVSPDKFRDFCYIMEELLFLPNSPTLMNAGTPCGQLAACFVIPIHDSLEDIFSALSIMARIHQSGGGTGFAFSHIRPRGDCVGDAAGVASGPVSFIRVFDAATTAVKQGGRRRGANMGVLNASHPDIREFITMKDNGGLANFNLSVGFDAGFFASLKAGKPIPLINPRDGTIWEEADPGEIWNLAAMSAWSTGDPGVLFLDEINQCNTVPGLGRIEATNPCGEQPLFPFESCNLGSLNLSRFVLKNEIDTEKLRYTIRTSIEFLDRVIDANHISIPAIREATLKTRKVGLGVMGFAEMLILLGIPYESGEALRIADEVMGFIQNESRAMSEELGRKLGSFPAIDASIYSGEMRNATVTTIAPTGSLHILADTTSGIEPLFAPVYDRRIGERKTRIVNRLFSDFAQRVPGGTDLIAAAAKSTEIEDLPIPAEQKALFKTAQEISPGHQILMQARFQKHVDNAVSKTINLPTNTTSAEIGELFLLARDCRCKGLTVYREKSRKDQVLTHSCDICHTTG